MTELSGFPYFEVEFTKDGKVYDQDQVGRLMQHLDSEPITDLLAISHGWNNDMDQARTLYKSLLGQIRSRIGSSDGPDVGKRKFAVMAILWPSKKFAEEELIAGGAASLDAPAEDSELIGILEDLKGAFDDPGADDRLERAKGLVDQLETSEQARNEFADLIRDSLPKDEADDEDASDEFFELPGDELLNRLATPTVPADEAVPPAGTGGAASIGTGDVVGSAAGIGDFISNIKGSARSLLNFATYYQMKARSGTVGAKGANAVLRKIKSARPDLKLHLVGHSFGGRLVAAAALGEPGKPPVRTSSLTLLQAAFSHYGFSQDYEPKKDGLFRAAISSDMLEGPALITHTDNDRAVGLAYPMASRIARQVASGLGDKNDRYGGIGRNGAQKTPEAIPGELLAAGKPYSFQAGSVFNLRADNFIANHSDVTGKEVAHALLAAIATT